MSMNPEDSLISVLMAHNESYWQVSEIVCLDDFSPKGRRLYAAIAGEIKAGRNTDEIITGARLGKELAEEAMSIAFHAGGSIANVQGYARVLAERGERRRVREAGQRIQMVENYAEAQAVLASVRPQQAAQLKGAVEGLREMMEALQARFESDSELTGVDTGLESLNAITGGYQCGDHVGVAGETSSGKTAFAIQGSVAAGRQATGLVGRPYYASLEMMASQLFERIVSQVGRIPYRWLRFPKEAPGWFVSREGLGRPEHGSPMTLLEATAAVRNLAIVVDDQPGLSIEQICSRARQLHMESPLNLVVVDHLNLVRRPRKNDAAELGEIAITLKGLAKELKVPVISLVQLNRGNKQRADRRPQLEDMRSSGEIEESLDTAVMVYRDEYHNPGGPLAGFAEFIVRKQRQGERNVTAWAKSYLSQMRFESCDEPERPSGNGPANSGRRDFASRFGQGSKSSQIPMAGNDD